MWSITLHSKHPALNVKFIILLLVHCTSLHTSHLIITLAPQVWLLQPIRYSLSTSIVFLFGALHIPLHYATHYQGQEFYQPITIAFLSKYISPVECNYKIHDKEMLVVVRALEEWRHFVEGAEHRFKIWTDHKNLKYFMTAKKLDQQWYCVKVYMHGYAQFYLKISILIK